MRDENTLAAEMARGEKAKRILEDELVKEALQSMRKNLMTEWERSKVNDQKGREKVWLTLHVLNEFERALASHMETGKFAKIEMSKLQQMRKKVSNLFN